MAKTVVRSSRDIFPATDGIFCRQNRRNKSQVITRNDQKDVFITSIAFSESERERFVVFNEFHELTAIDVCDQNLN